MNTYLLAVTAATVAYMILGYAWYSEFLFGSVWRKLTGVKLSAQEAKRSMLNGIVLSFFTACVFTYLLASMPVETTEALRVAVWGWLVFSLPFALQGYVYRKQPLLLIAIDSLFNLANYIVMAAVIIYFL